ncbi:MAG: hypothetical protein U0794_18205 [Isosphaeraceae bacterium]
MANWPKNPRLIGTRIPRLDGLAKASGRAKYPSDVRPEGTLFGALLYSPHAHAKIKSIDTSAAEKLPGVKAIHVIAKPGATLRYQGDDIAASPPRARNRHATRSVPSRSSTRSCRTSSPRPRPWPRTRPRSSTAATSARARADRGNPEEAMAKADATIEATYSLPVITHVCLEPHGRPPSGRVTTRSSPGPARRPCR